MPGYEKYGTTMTPETLSEDSLAHIQDESKQIWKTYQERLYAILKSIIEAGIKKKEFIDLNPGMLMKAIGGLFHGLLIENEDDLDDKEFELMLRNFLRPENAEN